MTWISCAWDWITDHATVLSAVVSALAAVAIACFTVKLSSATRGQLTKLGESINLARDEFDATHRPKIRVKHLWLPHEIWRGEPIKIDLVIVNVGDVPAKIGRCRLTTFLVPAECDLPPKVDFTLEFAVTGQPLPSGITLVVKKLTDTRKLSDAEIMDIRSRKMTLYCIGIIEYQDTKGTGVRVTAFCRYLDIPEHPLSSEDVGRLKVKRDADYEYED